jgi:D-alanyl-D-alanine carboxypeptidase
MPTRTSLSLLIALLSGFTALSAQAFTAVLVMKAIEAGKLNLDAADISIRHLLSHRSGIANFTDNPAYLAWHTQNRTRSEMLQHISTLESNFEPGSRSAYSNSNYVLLTLILEALFQQNYKDLLEQHITEPVGLTNTFFDPEASADSLGSRSYLFNTTWEESPTTHLSIPLGAGGIITTLVHFNNVMGRIYFLPVKPFHGCIIRTTFKKMERKLLS